MKDDDTKKVSLMFWLLLKTLVLVHLEKGLCGARKLLFIHMCSPIPKVETCNAIGLRISSTHALSIHHYHHWLHKQLYSFDWGNLFSPSWTLLPYWGAKRSKVEFTVPLETMSASSMTFPAPAILRNLRFKITPKPRSPTGQCFWMSHLACQTLTDSWFEILKLFSLFS